MQADKSSGGQSNSRQICGWTDTLVPGWTVTSQIVGRGMDTTIESQTYSMIMFDRVANWPFVPIYLPRAS